MIQKAIYITDYKIYVIFKDGKEKTIDLKEFLQNSTHPLINKFLDLNLFKNFRLEYGTLAWGNNEFDLSPMSIYNGDFDVKENINTDIFSDAEMLV